MSRPGLLSIYRDKNDRYSWIKIIIKKVNFYLTFPFLGVYCNCMIKKTITMVLRGRHLRAFRLFAKRIESGTTRETVRRLIEQTKEYKSKGKIK